MFSVAPEKEHTQNGAGQRMLPALFFILGRSTGDRVLLVLKDDFAYRQKYTLRVATLNKTLLKKLHSIEVISKRSIRLNIVVGTF